MTFLAIASLAIIVVTIHYMEKSKKSKKQMQMLSNIESLLKEIRKLYYIYEKFGDMEPFNVYLENTAKRLYYGSLSDKEFEEYKLAFRTEMQTKYKTLLYELAFVNPNLKKLLIPEYFGKIC